MGDSHPVDGVPTLGKVSHRSGTVAELFVSAAASSEVRGWILARFALMVRTRFGGFSKQEKTSDLARWSQAAEGRGQGETGGKTAAPSAAPLCSLGAPGPLFEYHSLRIYCYS